MIELNKIYNEDCLEGMKRIPDASIDLIITDPPYQIDNVKAGGNSKLAKSIQKMNDQIEENNLTQGFDKGILSEMLRVLKTPNLYIWCNHKQIPMYLDFFVKEHGCSFDIIIWKKTNAAPLFNNKYLTDKEYCLYFRKNGYCNPENYDRAKTVYVQPMNVKDKHQFGHPTIKPLNIITNLLLNSSKKNDTILDPFMGSGTTAVAAINNERNFLGFENNEEYFEQSIDRIKNNVTQMTLL
ncbi:site-specific DNA-methyltransferase [Enterococcus sp. BWR-S5]|nr:site-specific DNA-methyltransferase [Enterococcus sp. BWR-S5]